MIKKNIEENFDDEIKEELDFPVETVPDIKTRDEIIKELEKSTEIKSVSKGTPLTVYRNEGKSLFLIDSKGNGIKIPTPEQYKNVKKGDIIYI
jgi:hypothetical protein